MKLSGVAGIAPRRGGYNRLVRVGIIEACSSSSAPAIARVTTGSSESASLKPMTRAEIIALQRYNRLVRVGIIEAGEDGSDQVDDDGYNRLVRVGIIEAW